MRTAKALWGRFGGVWRSIFFGLANLFFLVLFFILFGLLVGALMLFVLARLSAEFSALTIGTLKVGTAVGLVGSCFAFKLERFQAAFPRVRAGHGTAWATGNVWGGGGRNRPCQPNRSGQYFLG